MEIKILNANESHLQDLEIPLFIYKEYLKSLQNVQIIHFYEKGELLSIVPIEIKKRLWFKIGRLLYEPYPNNTQKLMDALIVFLKENKLIHFLQATPNYIPFKFYPKGASFCDFGTYRLDLVFDEEDLFKNLHSKHRNVIRKCEKENLKIIFNNKNIVKECYQLLKQTMQRSNMEYPNYDYLEKLFLNLPNNIFFGVVYHNDIPQGTIYLFYTQKRAYYIYGGSIDKPFTGAMNYLHWNAIKLLKQNGVKSYDFVGARIEPIKGSKTEGIQRFKERFGANMYKGFMWKYIFNKPMYALYIFMIKLISWKNGTHYMGDIIEQENNR